MSIGLVGDLGLSGPFFAIESILDEVAHWGPFGQFWAIFGHTGFVFNSGIMVLCLCLILLLAMINHILLF